jgi:hypothetical protein
MTAILSPALIFQGVGFAGLPLPGGKLFSYIAGTSTPQATYTDSTQSTPNANPVILNANGQAAVWLDPTKTYKFILQDAFGNQIYSTDQVQGSLTAAVLTQQFLGAILNPQTPAELAASVTPLNYDYLPGVIERYLLGVNIPYSTSMTAAFQAAVNQARVGGGADVIVGTTGGILLDGGIDMTTPSGVSATRYAVTVRGVRNLQAVTNNSPYYGTILLKHTATAAFDNTGAVGVNFENLSIGTDTSTYPKICFLVARNADASSAPDVRFRNVEVLGNFKISVLYNYGIEDDEYYGCHFWNFASDLGSRAMVFTGTNYLYGVTSTFTTILGSGANHNISTQDHKFFGGTYQNNRGSPNLSTVAITGIAGQFSCAAASLVVGQPVAITGTFGGGGSITGYQNPTVYYISATNGSTTFTLQTAAGAAIVTTAGTPTGLTYAAQTSDAIYLESIFNFRMYAPWMLASLTGVNPGRSIIYIDTKNSPSSNITIDAPMIENQAPNQQNFMIFIGNEGTALSVANTNYNVRGGGTSANIACIYNSAASALSNVFWWQNSIQGTPFGLINDGTIGNLFSDVSLQQNGGGAGNLTRTIPLLSGPIGIQSPGDAYFQLNDPNAAANSKIYNFRNTGGTFSLVLATDANANTTTVLQVTRTGTTLNQMSIQCPLGVNGNNGPAQSSGWGSPVGGAVINNYNITDAGGANSNTNKAVAQIIAVLKAVGFLAS